MSNYIMPMCLACGSRYRVYVKDCLSISYSCAAGPSRKRVYSPRTMCPKCITLFREIGGLAFIKHLNRNKRKGRQ
jgi:hypothetical protein